ncbi:MAG: molybdopterin-dependent oxidoreductase [Desulfobacteraceae bacterium]|nr:molybdopterin-dependent oxidoreductase [Desulfobacteraceae bacterium]MBC2756201.1 molybdopterin-dependent oxidoreductase [Desulfobacteraceae bacterium]
MKIDRRSFLTYGTALVLGGAAGSMLTPAPWKLTDDVAIWTQNWPWTPVPEDGEITYKQSVCTLCPGGCGINVRLVNGRPIKIEGSKDHPANKGSLCPMGISGLQYLYGPSRVTSPLKREGKRGEGKWKKVSWEEALTAVAKKLAELRENGRPQSVACITGSDRGTIPNLIGRFLTAYGSPNYIRSANAQDAIEQAIYLAQGKQGTPGFDIEKADFILSFGSGLLDGWGSPGRMFNLYGNQKPAKKIIQIEPRLSDTAAKATQWIGINPGTEGALALGIAHVIIKESLYDRNFVENYAFGFDDWTDDNGKAHDGFAKMAKKFAPEKVSRITGIPKAEIVSLARAFARASKPIALNGRGHGSVPGSIDESLAVQSLNALVGNINKPGGISAMPDSNYAKWPEVNIDEIASKGMQQPRIDGAGSEQFPNTRFLLNRLPEIINSAQGESPIQALMVTDANPLYTLPDTAATKKAFDRIPFIVSFSPYMDETASHADYILPNHSYLERLQDVPTSTGISLQVTGLAKPVVKPLYDTKHVGDSFIHMAKALGGFIENAFPWDDYEAFLKETLNDQWRKFKRKGVIEIEHNLPEPLAYTFNTVSGKFEFYPTARNSATQKENSALPSYTPVPIEGDVQRFKLVLIPYDSIRLASGYMANAPFMTKTVDDTVLKNQIGLLEINPATAKELSLKEGDTAILTTPKGKATVKIHLYEGIMPGIIAMPRGLGHTAYSEYLADKGTNFNELIGPIEDPTSGLDMAWGIRAKLTRA